MERRKEERLMCAEMVAVVWKQGSGKKRSSLAILEDIAPSGACVHLEVPIAVDSSIVVTHSKGKLRGTVRHCVYREIGYFVGIQFSAESRWSRRQFKPQHLLDLKQLIKRSVKRAAKRSRPPYVM